MSEVERVENCVEKRTMKFYKRESVKSVLC